MKENGHVVQAGSAEHVGELVLKRVNEVCREFDRLNMMIEKHNREIAEHRQSIRDLRIQIKHLKDAHWHVAKRHEVLLQIVDSAK